MAEQTTREQLTAIVTASLGVAADQLKDDANFVSDLGADSLDQMEIAFEIEDQLDVTVSDDDIEHAKTFGDMVRLVEAAIQKRAAA